MRMHRFVSYRGVLLMSLLMSAAFSQDAMAQRGQVLDLSVRRDGLIIFSLSGERGAKPSCATNNYWIVPNENSDYGKRVYAALLAARSSGATVDVWGSGTCTRWSDGEDVELVTL